MRPVKLRARWNGLPPKIGDYLMSEIRPRFAYRVCEVSRTDRIVAWDPTLKTEFVRFSIVATRVARNAVPAGAKVHPWRWDRRGKIHSPKAPQ
jgi:hypothetical protein